MNNYYSFFMFFGLQIIALLLQIICIKKRYYKLSIVLLFLNLLLIPLTQI